MFKKVNCKHCNEMYDETFDECPNCHAINEDLDPSFKNLTMIPWYKQISLFAMGLGGFELLGFIIVTILYASGLADKNAALADILLQTLAYCLTIVSLILILYKDNIKLTKSFKNWRNYVGGILCIGLLLVFNYIYAIILYLSNVQIAPPSNQDAIDSMVKTFPLVTAIVIVILGPVSEEITYRVGLFSFLSRISKWLAYPLTALVFSLIHMHFTPQNYVNELINLPLYFVPGLILCFAYDKFGFAGSLTAHLGNNLISMFLTTYIVGVAH